MAQPMTRGTTIQRLRKERGVSQTQLAHAIGIETQGTISNWENDKTDIDHANLLKLVDYFGVDPETLGVEMPRLGGSEPPAWFLQFREQQMAELREIRELLEVLVNR